MSSRVMTWIADAVSDRCSGRREHGADLDGHQLLEAHVLERAGRGQGVRSLSRRAGDEDERAEGSLNWQQSGQEAPSSMSR